MNDEHEGQILTDATEYCEGEDVFIDTLKSGRLIIRAYNEGGHNCTEVDLKQLLAWLKINLPGTLK